MTLTQTVRETSPCHQAALNRAYADGPSTSRTDPWRCITCGAAYVLRITNTPVDDPNHRLAIPVVQADADVEADLRLRHLGLTAEADRAATRIPLSRIETQMAEHGTCDLPDDATVVLFAELVRARALIDTIRTALVSANVGPETVPVGDVETWRAKRSEVLADIETALHLRGER